jgi:biopolymer transport protein ExbD
MSSGGGSGGGGESRHGFGGLFGRESTASYEVYLNLTPLMDVMSNILFFLLAAFGASIIAVLPTTVPLRSEDASSSLEAEEKKVTVTVHAGTEGLAVRCESASLTPEQLAPYGVRLPMKGKDYDLAGLTEALRRIKTEFPASKTLIVAPDDTLRYEVVIAILDATRSVRMPLGVKIDLFPSAVLSGLERAEVTPAR